MWFSVLPSGFSHATKHFQSNTSIVTVFLCLLVCSDNMRCSHFIPHVTRHYSCCFQLIDSSFFHFISTRQGQGLLQALLPSIADVTSSRKWKEMKRNMCINNCVSWITFKKRKVRFKVEEKNTKRLLLWASTVSSKLVSWNMKIAPITEERGQLCNICHFCLSMAMIFINTVHHQAQ